MAANKILLINNLNEQETLTFFKRKLANTRRQYELICENEHQAINTLLKNAAIDCVILIIASEKEMNFIESCEEAYRQYNLPYLLVADEVVHKELVRKNKFALPYFVAKDKVNYLDIENLVGLVIANSLNVIHDAALNEVGIDPSQMITSEQLEKIINKLLSYEKLHRFQLGLIVTSYSFNGRTPQRRTDHEMMESIVIEIAEIIRTTDFVLQLGKNQIAVILLSCSDEQMIANKAARILQHLRQMNVDSISVDNPAKERFNIGFVGIANTSNNSHNLIAKALKMLHSAERINL